MDSIEVQLARIDEGVRHLQEKIDRYHEDVKPVKKTVANHATAIAVLRRDRWWILSLGGVLFSGLAYLLFGKPHL